jgi:hypothetical protein
MFKAKLYSKVAEVTYTIFKVVQFLRPVHPKFFIILITNKSWTGNFLGFGQESENRHANIGYNFCYLNVVCENVSYSFSTYPSYRIAQV